MLKPFKYVVQCVALELDDDGNVVGERVADPVPCYGRASVVELIDKAEAEATVPEPEPKRGAKP